MFLPKRRSTIAELHLLQKENDGLRTEIVKLRHELTNKQGYAERLEVLLRERLERIDDLNGKLEQAREQNKRLKAEAEHLAIVAARPSMLRAWLTKLRALTPQLQGSDCSPPARRVTG
jgi:chromosome segregation ATPase